MCVYDEDGVSHLRIWDCYGEEPGASEINEIGGVELIRRVSRAIVGLVLCVS